MRGGVALDPFFFPVSDPDFFLNFNHIDNNDEENELCVKNE